MNSKTEATDGTNLALVLGKLARREHLWPDFFKSPEKALSSLGISMKSSEINVLREAINFLEENKGSGKLANRLGALKIALAGQKLCE